MITSIKKDYAIKVENRFLDIVKAIASLRYRLINDFPDEEVKADSRLETELHQINHHLYSASSLVGDCIDRIREVSE